MKQNGRVSRVLAYAATAACVAFVSYAQAAAEVGKAVVRSVHGSAKYSEGATWNDLQSGQTLKPGTAIRTANDSSVDLFLGDNGPLVKLLENTTLGLDKLNYEVTGVDTVIETSLDLKSGGIVGIVSKLSAASKYEVKTPNGVSGVRGTSETEFRVFANGVTQVFKGDMVSVYVKPSGSVQTESLTAGDQFDPASGKGSISKADLSSALVQLNTLRGVPTTVGGIGANAVGGVASSTALLLSAGQNNQIGMSQVPVISLNYRAGDQTSIFLSPVTSPED